MTHSDRALRVLRQVVRAWAEMLRRNEPDAATGLSLALAELEQDITFARCWPVKADRREV
jgi:hypothetical protein